MASNKLASAILYRSGYRLPHVYNHQVNEEEVMDVLDEPARIGPAVKALGPRWARQLREGIFG